MKVARSVSSYSHRVRCSYSYSISYIPLMNLRINPISANMFSHTIQITILIAKFWCLSYEHHIFVLCSMEYKPVVSFVTCTYRSAMLLV